jgi:NAD(P)H-dependent FMN reductase
MNLNITILYGSYRSPRLGIHVVKHLEAALKKAGHTPFVVDAKALDIPMLDKRFVDYAPGTAPQVLVDLKDRFENRTDAFIIVSGEYNGTLQPGLKNLLDHFYVEFFHRPCGLVTYSVGGLGGARVSADLRTIAGIFGMPAIPQILSFAKVHEVMDDAGNLVEGGPSQDVTDAFVNQLAWYGRALKREKEQSGVPA